MRHTRVGLHHWLLGLLVAGALCLALPRLALAWTEARPGDAVTEFELGADGNAVVTQRVRWRVLAGRLHEFELTELPADLSLIEATANTATGTPVPITVRGTTPGRLTVTLGDPGVGLARGSVDVVLRYGTSLRAQGAIRRTDGDAIIELHACPWERGMEATELRVSLPSAERRARWIADDVDGVDATVNTELSRDVLRTMRRHVPTGVTWTARVAVDPAVFPWLSAGVPRPTARPVRRAPWSPLSLVYGLGLAAVLFIAAQALRRLEGPARLTLPRALRPLPPLLAIGAATAHSFALTGTQGCVSVGTACLLGALVLSLPRRATGPRRRASPWITWGRRVVLAALAVGFVLAVRARSTPGLIGALDLATLVVASMAVSLLRTPVAVPRPAMRAPMVSATRSLGLDDLLVSASAGAAGGTSSAHRRPSSPRSAPPPA